MSAQFVAASSQYLLNSSAPIITAVPFTVGVWFKCNSTPGNAYSLFSVANGASTTSLFSCDVVNAAGLVAASMTAGDTAITIMSTGAALTIGRWYFGVFRAITATNRRVDCVDATGATSTTTSTTSRVPTSLTRSAFGARPSSTITSFLDGYIAEIWYTNTDIQPDGLALNTNTLRQLAYGGPYSVPYIGKDIQEYRSFRSSLTSDQDKLDEYDFGGAGRQIWVNTGGVTLGPHPPLPGWYEKPIDIVRPSLPI